jgi:hypothetical protein
MIVMLAETPGSARFLARSEAHRQPTIMSIFVRSFICQIREVAIKH